MRESGKESAGWNPPGNRKAAGRGTDLPPGNRKTPDRGTGLPQGSGKPQTNVYEVRGNQSQREAICHFTGPCEVLAGPGSGKTFVITERILRLIRYQRMDPSRILVLTFSKAAAMEMRQRFQKRSAPDSYPVTFGTFHSVFYHILQQSTEGDTPLSIIPEKSQLQLVENLMLRFCHKKPSAEETAAMLSLIAACKASGRFPVSDGRDALSSGSSIGAGDPLLSDVSIRAGDALSSGSSIGAGDPLSPEASIRAGKDSLPGLSIDSHAQDAQDGPGAHIGEILRDYNMYLAENHLIDFEDMIGRCLDLLKSREDILHYWQERFQFLLVDEFQDINAGQFEVLRLLAGHRKNLFVVGDDDQSIYGFRGSDPSFMMRFPSIFPGCRVITLEINYRCQQHIIDLSGKVIHENRQRLDKTVRAAARKEDPGRGTNGPGRDGGAAVAGYPSREEEYAWIAGTLRSMPLSMQSKCAIIFRTHMQMAGMIRYFDRKGIPYREAAGRRRKGAASSVLSPKTLQLLEVIRGYYRLAQACGSGELRQGSQIMDGSGRQGSKIMDGSSRQASQIMGGSSRQGSKIIDGSGRQGSKIMDGSSRQESRREYCPALRRSDLFLVMNCPERFLLRNSFRKSSYTVSELMNLYPRGSAEEKSIRRLLADLQALKRLSPPMSWRWLKRVLQMEIPEPEWLLLDQLISEAAEQAESFHVFLAALEGEELPGRLTSLLSARETAAAKQKEGVLLITMHASKGLEFEGVFIPDLNEGILPNRSAVTEAAIEEERRLLYVAMTRARSRLFLLYIRGTKENPRRPSRFLEVLGVKTWEY